MSCVPKLKLTYFNASGRAESVRLALHLGGIPFVDERVNHEQFAKLKPTLVYGQLPVLQVDGVEMAQSQAMLRFAGKLAGLYPVNDPIAALQVDEILSTLEDLKTRCIPAMFEADAEKQKALGMELASTTIPHFLTMLDARLATMKASNAVFQDPSALFIHDLELYTRVMSFQAGRIEWVPTDIAAPYPEVMAAFTKVAAHPRVQAWNAMHDNSLTKPLTIKLTYFQGTGRAEPIRLAFAIAGVAFEDERIAFEAFPSIKKDLPYGQLPVLQVNDQVCAQSVALLRYAGAVTGLYPVNDPVMAFRVDEVLDWGVDVWAAAGLVMHMPESEAKIAAGKKLMGETLPSMVGNMDKRVATWNDKFAVGPTLTLADLILFSLTVDFEMFTKIGLPKMPLDDFEHVLRVSAQVGAIDKVQAYYANLQQQQ